MNHIYLTGFMGVGKSTVGFELARILQVEFVDVDQMIVASEDQTINNIFSVKGEAYFRDLESQTLKSLSKKKSLVVATGGGCVEHEKNRELMKSSGKVVYLDTSWQTIIERLSDTDDRPLASCGDDWISTRTLYEKRIPFYLEADYIINTAGKMPRQLAREIADLVG